MAQNQPACSWKKQFFRSLMLVFLLGSWEVGIGAFAQDQSQRPDASQRSAALDGHQFVGTLTAKGDNAPDNDAFTFKDGKFVSEGCLKWGFSPAPYWVRRDADGLHFLSELSSPEHGTMRYEGVFDGKELTGTAYWKKARWYWTLEREYIFQGKPAGSNQ